MVTAGMDFAKIDRFFTIGPKRLAPDRHVFLRHAFPGMIPARYVGGRSVVELMEGRLSQQHHRLYIGHLIDPIEEIKIGQASPGTRELFVESSHLLIDVPTHGYAVAFGQWREIAFAARERHTGYFEERVTVLLPIHTIHQPILIDL